MNAVFTIVARNFLARALTLGDSVRKHQPGASFFIFLSDEPEGTVPAEGARYPIVAASDLGIPQFRQMAFYYSLLELSCAIKPFCFQHLARTCRYEHIVYFDPDVYLYNSLDPIFAALAEKDLMLTPHLTDMARTKDGAMPETSFLFVGAYNLGFIAVRTCAEVERFLAWWGERLVDRGFADQRDGQHVDQKWLDLIPGLLGDKAVISRDPGHNAAQWNVHERQLTCRSGTWFVNDRPLVFFHHASFDPHAPGRFAQRQDKFTVANRPDLAGLLEAYAAHLLSNRYDEYLKLPYAYARFANGLNIFAFQRRMFRVIVQSRKVESDPFAVGPGTFFDLLLRNRLVIHDREKAEFVQADFKASGRGVRSLKRGQIWLKRIIGIKAYYLLMRWLYNNSRPEEQVFLIDKGLDDLR